MYIPSLHSVDELFQVLHRAKPEDHRLYANARNRTPKRLAEAIKNAKALVADFDGTLTPGGQWIAMKAWLNDELRQLDKVQTDYYFANLHREDYEDLKFLFDSIHRFKGMPLTTFNAFARNLAMREGAKPLFESFEPSNTCIISFGIKNFIEEWLAHHKISNDVTVFALQVLFSETLKGYRPETAVSDGNKGYMRDTFVAERGLIHSELLVIGDAPTDLKMMHAGNVGILIIPKIDPDPQRMTNRLRGLDLLWPQLSGVLISDTLTPLAELRTTSR